MSFSPAVRRNLILLLGIVSKSGGGKTKSALMLARGLVGPNGKIKAIDSENRRMSYHAGDPAIGQFEVADLQPPYTPERYLQLLNEAFKSADVVVIDSLSHEWNGEGGCLAMVDKILDDKCKNDWDKRDKFKMFAWGQVTPKHDALVAAICRAPVPVICCFRAKDKIVMEKEEPQPGQRAKTTISIDEDAPVQRKDLIHEMTMIFGLEQRDGVGGYYQIKKRTTEGLYQAVKSIQGDQLTVAHGESLARWCADPSGSINRKSDQQDRKTKMFSAFRDAGIGESGLRSFAEQKGWVAPNEQLGDWPETRIPATVREMKTLIDEVLSFLGHGSV